MNGDERLTAGADADQAVERMVLAVMMLDRESIPEAVQKLARGDFYDPKHGPIFTAILSNYESGEPTEPNAVMARLLDMGELERVGGAKALAEIVEQIPDGVPPGVGYYLGKVLERSYRRTALEKAVRAQDRIRAGDATGAAAALDAAQEALAGPNAAVPGPWSPIDLGPFLDGQVNPAVPSVGVRRTDDIQLIYPGKEHSVVGEMEGGKSWFCVASAAEELKAGHCVVYVHFEEADPSGTVGRLLDLDVAEKAIRERFFFVAPNRPVTVADCADLLRRGPVLVVLDGVNEAMALHGWGVREEDGAASFRRDLVLPFTRAGVATLAADHVVKDVDKRGRNAIGSIHKGNGLSGALIMLENRAPFGRGARGRSAVFVTKDRPGHLRQHGLPEKLPGKTYIGEFVVDDTRERNPWLELTFHAPTAAPLEAAPTGLAQTDPVDRDDQEDGHIVDVVASLNASGAEATVREIRERTRYGNAKTSEVLGRVVKNGLVIEVHGPRKAKYHRVASGVAARHPIGPTLTSTPSDPP